MKSWMVAVTLAIAASVSGSGVGAADTAQGKELVVLGDSFSANAWVLQAQTSECRHGDTSWPTQLSRLMGVAGTDDYLDMSCPGASLDTPPNYTASWEAKQAAQVSAFGPRTKVVALQFGINDRWGTQETTAWYALQQCVLNLIQGCGTDATTQGRLPDASTMTGAAYAARIRNVIDYVKYYAPNAHIVLVGYPELFSTGQPVCFGAFGLTQFVQPRGQAIPDLLDRLDTAQRDAARQLAIDFYDARTATTGHGLCTDQPWINDYQNPQHPTAIPFHPSEQGDAVLANGIYAQAGH
ncbi:SGNH/GDSL hydrolase family protein [Nocardia sp. NPDC051030]|uniref:SGNH/GDSL hydrolase family protein n=1 Tax=Nocardia sp. NPDC051030 TaxID=3155162 RepID=UPI00344939D7